MNVAGERPGPAERETATALAPEFYVALELVGDGQCCRPGLLYAPLTEAVVRAYRGCAGDDHRAASLRHVRRCYRGC
jgi:hypothetical protein